MIGQVRQVKKKKKKNEGNTTLNHAYAHALSLLGIAAGIMLLSMFADVRAQCYVVLSNALYTKAHALCWPPLVCCSLEIRVSCLKTGAVIGKCKKNVSIRPHWATNLDVERGLDRDVMVV